MAKKNNQTFPLLNTEEAEEIVHELGLALDADRDWTEKFREMLVCRAKPKAAVLDADAHEKTVFGRWYFGKVNPHLHDHPDFRVIGKHNKRMHGLARGLARMMGIRLMVNFNNPYLAASLGDFWSRWHISLSTWFRDYVYVPLGGNRRGRFLLYRNLLLTNWCGRFSQPTLKFSPRTRWSTNN